MRRSILADAKADMLLYGNAERALVEIAHRLAAAKPSTRSPTSAAPRFSQGLPADWTVIDSTNRQTRSRRAIVNPYQIIDETVCDASPDNDAAPGGRRSNSTASWPWVQQKLAAD